MKPFERYTITGLPGGDGGSLEVHSHGFKMTKVSTGVRVCVCVCPTPVMSNCSGEAPEGLI